MKSILGVSPVRHGGAFLALAVFVAVFLWFTVPGAAASQVQAVSVQACVDQEGGGCGYTSTVRVDQAFGLNVAFNVTNPLVSGTGTIYVRGPAGTVFKPGATNHVSLNVGLSGYAVPSQNVAVIEDGRTVSVRVPAYVSPAISPADDLDLKIGNFTNVIETPPVPGQFGVEVWTSSDVEGRESDNSITTTIGLPGALTTTGDDASAAVTQSFSTPVIAKVTDSRGNSLAGESITFTLPGEEAEGGGGSFPGDEVTFNGSTNAQGIVTAPTITANETAGAWGVEVDGPGSLAATVVLNNTPAPAFEIELDVDPAELPADGHSTANAEISVADQFGNSITGDDLTIATGGGPTATAPVVAGDVYTSQLIASTAPGVYSITATDTSATPDLTAEFELEQTELPASTIDLKLVPSSIPADGVTQSTATVTVLDELGHPVPETLVTIESAGGQSIDTPVPGPGGTFTAKILSTTVPGVSAITATVESADPELSASAGLTQTTPVIPPPPPPPPAVKPVVKIKSGPKGKTGKAKVKFKFAVTKGTAKGFQCKLDKKKWAKCRSPKTVKVKRGRHVFQVRGIATDGSFGKAVKRKFKRIQ